MILNEFIVFAKDKRSCSNIEWKLLGLSRVAGVGVGKKKDIKGCVKALIRAWVYLGYSRKRINNSKYKKTMFPDISFISRSCSFLTMTQNEARVLSFLPEPTLYEPCFESVNRLNDHYTMQCWENKSRFHYLCINLKRKKTGLRSVSKTLEELDMKRGLGKRKF